MSELLFTLNPFSIMMMIFIVVFGFWFLDLWVNTTAPASVEHYWTFQKILFKIAGIILVVFTLMSWFNSLQERNRK